MNSPAVHLEILPTAQRAVLARVGPVASQLGFYLAGGTAVALRLGHRLSMDLDWFTGADELDPLALEDAGPFRVAAMADLVCMKLAAATQRGEKKDFYDIAAICDGHVGLAEALELYRRKFGLSGSGHALMALTYFDDAEAGPDPIALGGLTWPEVKRRIVAWAKELSRP